MIVTTKTSSDKLTKLSSEIIVIGLNDSMGYLSLVLHFRLVDARCAMRN